MLLNPYVYQCNNQDSCVNTDSFVKANISYHNRKIYIVPKKWGSGSNSIFSYYKCYNIILINISKSKDKNGIDYYIKSTYSFDYSTTENDIISAFKRSRLYLNYAMTNGYMFDDENLYYEDFGFTFAYKENNEPQEININDLMSDIDIESNEYKEKLKIPDPRYYTNKQYKIYNKKNYGSIMTYSQVYKGEDLIDDHTNIYYIEEKAPSKSSDVSKTDLVPVTDIQKIYETYEKYHDTDAISFDMFLINANSCFSSYKYIYDSNMGFNIKDIKSDNILAEDRRNDYLNIIAKKMNKICKKLTKEYGPVRVYYYSSDIIDKITIKFSDSQYNEISISYDKNTMFERLMVFLTDKYESIATRPCINYDEISENFEYFSIA